ncbi:WD40 repeat domain-containing protein [Cyanobium sp. ATX 6A2]|uniref:WD40 repeat domain-containing protein n=1 Tax=Cyanobium sp. ATX 6A2 TaxID=2823700 RepID=UPI0037BF3296
MVISPDGKSLLTGHTDGSAVLWNAEGVQLRRFENPSARSQVDQVAFDPSGSSIAIGEENGTVRRWSTTTGRLLSEIDTGLANLNAGPSPPVAMCGPDGTGRDDGTRWGDGKRRCVRTPWLITSRYFPMARA